MGNRVWMFQPYCFYFYTYPDLENTKLKFNLEDCVDTLIRDVEIRVSGTRSAARLLAFEIEILFIEIIIWLQARAKLEIDPTFP